MRALAANDPSAAQSRTGSLVEALVNVAVGYILALLVQQLLFPLFGLQVGLAGHGAIAAVFTVVSLARSYLLRRLFEHIAATRQLEQQRRQARLHQRLASGRF